MGQVIIRNIDDHVVERLTPPRKPGATFLTAEELIRENRGHAVSLVVDASVALKWFLSEEPHGGEALAIFARWSAPDRAGFSDYRGVQCGMALGKARPHQPSSQPGEIAANLPRFFDALVSATVLALAPWPLPVSSTFRVTIVSI